MKTLPQTRKSDDMVIFLKTLFQFSESDCGQKAIMIRIMMVRNVFDTLNIFQVYKFYLGFPAGEKVTIPYEVESINSNGCYENNTRMYEVKWKGYSNDENTWEPDTRLNY